MHSTLYTQHLTLHTLHSTLYTPHSTLYTPHSTLYTPHSTTLYTLHTPHSSLHTLHSTLLTLRSTLHTPHSTLHTPHFTLNTPHFTLHFPLHTPHSTLYTPHSTLYTLHSSLLYTLHTPHSSLHTPHFTLHTPYFTLRTPHSTLYTPHCALYTLYTPHSTLYYTPHSTLDTPLSTLCTRWPHETAPPPPFCACGSGAGGWPEPWSWKKWTSPNSPRRAWWAGGWFLPWSKRSPPRQSSYGLHGPAAFDLAVTCGLRQGQAAAATANGSRAAADYEDRKNQHLHTCPRAQGFQFLPLVAEVCMLWGVGAHCHQDLEGAGCSNSGPVKWKRCHWDRLAPPVFGSCPSAREFLCSSETLWWVSGLALTSWSSAWFGRSNLPVSSAFWGQWATCGFPLVWWRILFCSL